MPYKECPVCGAHLDHGERCDCENNELNEKESTSPSKTDVDSNVKRMTNDYI